VRPLPPPQENVPIASRAGSPPPRAQRRFHALCIGLIALGGLCLPVCAHAQEESESQARVAFVNITDLHLSTTARDGFVLSKSADRILADLVGEVNRRSDVRFVTVTGDLVADPRGGDLEVVRRILDGLRVPYYVIAGNHDRPNPRTWSLSAERRGARGFEEVFAGRGPQPGMRYWSLDPVPGLHLVGLDTTVAGRWGGRVDEEQLEWLKKDLDSHKATRTVVLSHHCLVEAHPWDRRGPWKNYVLENAESVREVLERFPWVVLVVSGHHHLCAARTVRGIHYITCPSPASWPCRYSVFSLSERHLAFSTHPAAPPEVVQKAWQNLLSFGPVRNRFPEGKEGEEEIGRVFMGPEHLELPLRSDIRTDGLR